MAKTWLLRKGNRLLMTEYNLPTFLPIGGASVSDLNLIEQFGNSSRISFLLTPFTSLFEGLLYIKSYHKITPFSFNKSNIFLANTNLNDLSSMDVKTVD